MRSKTTILLIASSLLVLLLTGCNDSSQKGQIKLPRKATEAVNKAYPEGKITGIEQEKENGKVIFEVDIESHGKTFEIEITPDGEILNDEGREEMEEKGGEQEQKEAEKANVVFNYDNAPLGKLPEGWSNQKTGKGGLGNWEVQADPTAPSKPNVFTQTSKKNFGYHFNLAVAEETNFSDLEIELQFKALTGEEDQGGGPVWRYRDADNYYICRANPLEGNFRVYKVVNGNRRQMKSASLPIPANQWHSIKVRNIGNHIQCWLNGKLYLDVKDDTFKSGKVGLWTKADAVTAFDNFIVRSEEENDD